MPDNNNTLLSNWQVAKFRVTGFLSPTEQISNVDSWWELVTETPPDNIVSQPLKREKRFEGPLGDGWLVLGLQSNRIDWHYGIHQNDQMDSEELLTLGSYSDTLSMFIQPLKRWFESADYPSMQRLAFGVELLHPVDDRVTGYENLATYLPFVNIDSKNTSEFLYRINRRRPSSVVTSLSINRLSTWSVQVFQSAYFHMQLGDITRRTIDQGKEFFHTKLVLDVNTAQEYEGEFDGTLSQQILAELISLAEEISTEGDKP